jgi:tetratricopeptide (TPR) repeat protein
VSLGVAAERSCIFISYRRDDACGASGRVWDWLRIGFGRERVFRDVASIWAGKWRQKIDEALEASKACVAVIGRRWADGTNLPRLLDPSDMVRHELETALASGERGELTVIPLLVESTQLRDIPKDELPESLRPLLADWNVLALSESGWDEDTRRLIETIASATGLPVNPELEDWMALMRGALNPPVSFVDSLLDTEDHEGRVQALEALLHLAAIADPAERPALKAAMAEMARRGTILAEKVLEQEVEKSHLLRREAEHVEANAEQQQTGVERAREGDAARHVGNLAVYRGDFEKACDYFERALHANPEDLEAAYRLGDACITRGDTRKAQRVFDDMIENGISLGCLWQRLLRVNWIEHTMRCRGDYPGALAACQAGVTIREGLVKRDPANTEWQRDLSVSHDQIGDVLVAQGDGPGALAAYQAGLTIREGLAKSDPANTQWHVDVAASCAKLGSLESLLSIQERSEYLSHGLKLLTELKQAGRLYPNQDWTGWFENALNTLT